MSKLQKGDIVSFTTAKQIDKKTKFVLITNPNPAHQAQLVCLDSHKKTFWSKGDICTMLVDGAVLVQRRWLAKKN